MGQEEEDPEVREEDERARVLDESSAFSFVEMEGEDDDETSVEDDSEVRNEEDDMTDEEAEVEGGEDEDGGGDALFAEGGHEAEAVAVGEAEVEDDGGVVLLDDLLLGCLGSMGDIDDVAGLFKTACDEVADGYVVFDDEHPHGMSLGEGRGGVQGR